MTGSPGVPEVHDLGRFEPFAFTGEAEVACAISERSLDFNVMTRRAWGSADVSVHHVTDGVLIVDPVVAGERLVVVLEGEVVIGSVAADEVRLGALDVAGDLDRPVAVRPLDAPAVVALVTITPAESRSS